MQNLFRAIPAVDASIAALHRADAALGDSQQTPHALLRDLVAAYWDIRREDIRAGRQETAAASAPLPPETARPAA